MLPTAGPCEETVSPIVPSATTSAAVTGIRTLPYNVESTTRAIRPLTRKVTTPLSTTSGMVSTPVIARGTTPAGTGTSMLEVLTAVVAMEPGTGVTSATAGAGATTPTARAGASARARAAARRSGRTEVTPDVTGGTQVQGQMQGTV